MPSREKRARCFMLFSMRRGGQHGVINWICSQYRPSVHVDDCSLINDKLVGMAPYKYLKGEKKRTQMNPSEVIDPDGFKMWLFNFEDQWIEEIQKKFLEWSQHVFTFDSVTNIVLVRDPYNLFASRSKDRRIQLRGEEARKIYKSHINTAMNNSDFVDINYNRWFTDKDYRKKLAGRLNIPFTDEGLGDIIWPGVSSFDGSGYDGRAQEMKVLERWKQLKDDFIVRELDDELVLYAKDYFNIREV
jgi:hypothetical protein